MINKVILIGYVGVDPEVRHLEGGAVVANFTLATSESYKDRSGEKVTKTEWHRIEVWRGLAEVCEKYVKKGSKLYIEGKIKTDKWTDDKGEEKSIKKIQVMQLQMLGDKAGQSSAQTGNPLEDSMGKGDIGDSEPTSFEEDDDDLPF